MIRYIQCFILGMILVLIMVAIAQSKNMILNTTPLFVGTILTLIISFIMDFNVVIDFWEGKK